LAPAREARPRPVPGVDTRRFAPALANAAVRQQLGWTNRSVVLTVARLQKRKGHDVMIEALKQVRTVVPDVLYAIVGVGEERNRLGEIVADSDLAGHVQFLGEVGDTTLVQCYQQCDLFVLPNRQVGRDIEGFGICWRDAREKSATSRRFSAFSGLSSSPCR
jgi:phosphatidylinositol alpha-1,6-mannosyltransferase